MARLALTLVAAALLCVTSPSSARSVLLRISPDAVYFPDQVAYIRASHGKCGEGLVYWPGNGRCYVEGSQGPCPFGMVLRWGDDRPRPDCLRDPAPFADAAPFADSSPFANAAPFADAEPNDGDTDSRLGDEDDLIGYRPFAE